MRSTRHRQLALLAIVCAGLTAVGITALSSQTALLKSFEHWTTDWRAALLADRAPSQHPGLAVVLIDDDTVQGLPYRSPIDRALLARLIETLDAAGARVIGLDFLFDQATEPDKDKQLIAAISRAAGRIVVGTVDDRVPLRTEQRQFLNDFLRKAGAASGYLNLRYEIDHVIRGEADPSPAVDGTAMDSFAGAIAKRSGAAPRAPSARIAWLAPPADGSDTFLVLPAGLIISPKDDAERSLAQLLLMRVRDRAVLIGGDLSDQADRHPTPLSKLGGELMPGALVHAHALAQYLDGRRIRLVEPMWEAILVFVMALAGFLLGWHLKPNGWVTSILPVVLLGVLDAIFFAGLRTIIPFAAPGLAWIAATFLARGARGLLAVLCLVRRSVSSSRREIAE